MSEGRIEQIRQTLEATDSASTPQYISATTYSDDVSYLLAALEHIEELEVENERLQNEIRKLESVIPPNTKWESMGR